MGQSAPESFPDHVMHTYRFREEEKPKFDLLKSSLIGLILLLLLFFLGERANPFRLDAAEVARLNEEQQQRQREMAFRFVEAPEDEVEEERDVKFLSDANHKAKSQVQEDAPKKNNDPFSKGNTYELQNNRRESPAVAQQPSPPVRQPEQRPTEAKPEEKPEERVAEEQQTKPEEVNEDQPKEVEEALQEEPREVAESIEVPEEKLDTSQTGKIPIDDPNAPKPYRKLSANELKQARLAALKEMDFTDAARIDPGTNSAETFDNPEGSSLPNLGLSVETTRSDLGPYLKILKQLIKGNWRIPNIARFEVSGVTGISFKIHKDGSFSEVKVLLSSHYEPLDVSALNAINNTNPAPPLPDHVDEEWIPIKFGFYYNMRPRY